MVITRTQLLQLIKKYNVQGPRYTSYPTALQFQPVDNKSMFWSQLAKYNAKPRDISLYIHIPFCKSLCWYCGCTKVIQKNVDAGSRYIQYMQKELAVYRSILHADHKVVQIHWGGGTPSFLKNEDIRELSGFIHTHFNIAENVEIGIEIDPREITPEKAGVLAHVGFNRASLGIQDVNKEVQEAIHRIQPHEMNINAVNGLRVAGINSINADLIYGLPRQTPANFKTTLHETLKLGFDRFAIYSYAHVPWIKPSQKLIHVDDLPESDAKLTMLTMAVNLMAEHGYEYIGMDHFSKKDDELAKALYEGTLQRNFQGYSTHAGVDIIGVGMSSISSIGPFYIQNTKKLDEYYRQLDNNTFTFEKCRMLDRDDLLRREIIMNIMCHNGLLLQEVNEKWNIDAGKYFADELNNLGHFEADGFILKLDNGFKITEKGRLFVRNIAMVFDTYLEKKPEYQSSYSKTI